MALSKSEGEECFLVKSKHFETKVIPIFYGTSASKAMSVITNSVPYKQGLNAAKLGDGRYLNT